MVTPTIPAPSVFKHMIKLSEINDYIEYGRCVASDDYEGALRALERCLAMPEIKNDSVNRAGLTQFMGKVYFCLGEKERAIECYNASEEIDASFLLMPYFYAKFLADEAGDFQSAIQKCDGIISRATAHPFPTTNDDFSSEWYVQKASELKTLCQQQLHRT